MGAAVVHFEVNGRDAKRLQEFYATLFDWKIDTNNPLQYGLVNTGLKTGIGGGIGQTSPTAPAGATFYVQVEDIQSYLDKAVQLGGKVVVPLTEIPNMITMALFADLDGNMIGLVKGPQTDPKPAKVAKPKKAAAKAKRKTSKPKTKGRKARRRR